jgi:ribose/xylose/arabinose/galactoside ABC-type transport system permease subunit
MKPTGNRLTLLLLQHSPLVLFVVIFIIFGLIEPRFLEFQTLENIIKQASYIGIVAVGMTFVLLTAGIDLSVGSNMYLSAAVACLLMQNHGTPPWLAFLICLGVGLTFGAVNALAITRLKIMPFIVTLATLVAGRGVGLMLTESHAIPLPEPVIQLSAGRLFGLIPWPIVLFAVVVVVGHFFLMRTPMGRQIYAVGFDLDVAKKAGLKTDRVLVLVYVLCGGLAALGGFISVTQLGVVNAGFGQNDEFDAIAAAVLGGASLFGGRGKVWPGTVLGALLIQMIGVGLVFIQIDLYLQPLIIALILFLAVLLDSVRTQRLKKLERRHIRSVQA